MASFFNITPEDFRTGILRIATNKHTEDDLQVYIDKFEAEYLETILGCELFALFFTDLAAGVPQDPIYESIFEPFCEDDDCKVQHKSLGMVEMVKRFIYFEYIRDYKVNSSNTGSIVNENEVSRETSISETKIFREYNIAVKTSEAIQWFICENESDYPTYNGKRIGKTSWL